MIAGLKYVLGSVYRYHRFLSHLAFNRCGAEYNDDCPDCRYGYYQPKAKKIKRGKQ